VTELSADACVVFDMDGVIVDSEPLWVRARKDLVRAAGGRWIPEAETAMMGISSDRWSVYMRDRLGLHEMTPAQIRDDVLARIVALYGAQVPLLPGGRGGPVHAHRPRLGASDRHRGRDSAIAARPRTQAVVADGFG
jgi:hypothetical protein